MALRNSTVPGLRLASYPARAPQSMGAYSTMPQPAHISVIRLPSRSYGAADARGIRVKESLSGCALWVCTATSFHRYYWRTNEVVNPFSTPLGVVLCKQSHLPVPRDQLGRPVWNIRVKSQAS